MTKLAERLKKHGFFFCLCFVLNVCYFVDITHAAQARDTRGKTEDGRTPLVLVLPFQINGGDSLQHLKLDFPRMLGKELGSRGIAVISNDKMLSTLGNSKTNLFNSSSAKNFATSVGATYAIYGTVNQIGSALSIDSHMVSVKTGAVKQFPIDQGGNLTDLNMAIKELALSVSHYFAPKDAIAGVDVRGTKILDPEVVLIRISTRQGDMADATIIDNDVKNIWNLGYFSDVSVNIENRSDGNYLVYTVVEKPKVESITVKGTKGLDADDVTSAMSIKQGSILNEKMLADDIQKIIEMYRKKGYYLATVSQHVDVPQNGVSARLTLTINEGKKLYIKSVNLEGVNQLSVSDVKSKMLLTERGLISWITGTGVLKEELIERDSSAITSYYLDHGFLDIVVGAPDIKYDPNGIIVTFPINEGTRYKLGKITFDGDLIDTEEQLKSLTKLDDLAAEGGFFNLSVMQEDQNKLSAYYADQGYAFAEINPNPQKRQDVSDVVDVIYYINKKNKMYIGRVTVEGNSKTRDNVIIRDLRLTDNEPFVGSKLRRSNERLNKLGYFEVAEIELAPTQREDEVDLKVKVKERPTGALMAGVSYSTFSNVGVAGTLMERNLFGKGYIASLQASVSGRRDAYTFSFTNPRLNDTDLSLGFDLYHLKDDYIDYHKRTVGGVARFSYPIGEYSSIGWGYRLDQYKIYDIDSDASKLISQYDTGDRFSSVGLLRLTRDSTDSNNPSSGNIDRLAFDYGGGFLGGDDKFISVSAEHNTFYQLWPDNVLHARVKGAAIFKNGKDDIPIFERFWMGGINSVRGYDSKDLVPRDKESGDRLGGTRMAFANLEYIWTFNREVGLSIVPFFDIGFNFDNDQKYTWSDEVKKSFGTELRWRSPLGDLRFAYGIPLDKDRRGRQDDGRFEFSMGQSF